MESTLELEIPDLSINGFAEDDLMTATSVLADITQYQKPDLTIQNISEPTNSNVYENAPEKEVEVKDENNLISEETVHAKIGADEFCEI